MRDFTTLDTPFMAQEFGLMDWFEADGSGFSASGRSPRANFESQLAEDVAQSYDIHQDDAVFHEYSLCGCGAGRAVNFGAEGAEIVYDEAGNPVDAVQGTSALLGGNDGVIVYYIGNTGYQNQYGVTYNTGANDIGEVDWTAAEITSIQQAFADISSFVDLTFVQTFDPAEADLTFIKNDNLPYLGYAAGTEGGTHYDIVMNHTISDRVPDGFNPGGQGYETLVHEIGHALGLGHTHDEALGSDYLRGMLGASAFTSGPDGLNDPINSIMAYRDGWAAQGSSTVDSGNRSTFGAWDVAALQNRFGAVNNNNGDNVYTLTTTDAARYGFSTIWDTRGTDTISAAGLTENATIDLRPATLLYDALSGGGVSYASLTGGFTIANGVEIENALGGDGDDTIVGNALDNVLDGGDGDDDLSGGNGNDTLNGNAGNDTLDGGAGDDTLDGGTGVDVIDGGDGTDTLVVRAQAGTPSAYVDFRTNVYNDQTGSGLESVTNIENATVYLASHSTLFGNAGDNRLEVVDGTATMFGGEGNDTLIVRSAFGSSTLTGENGNDTLIGGGGNDRLNGGDGVDHIDGGAGIDTWERYPLEAEGTVQIDLLTGVVADDGDGNAETVANIENIDIGYTVNSELLGTHGDNVIFARGNGHTIFGRSGDDEINVGAAGDFDGGNGNDTLVFGGTWAARDGFLRTGGLHISLDENTIYDDGFGFSGTVIRIENIIIEGGDDFADDLTGSNDDNILDGSDGNDFLNGLGGDDTLIGGTGDDRLAGGRGIDSYSGGDGFDEIIFFDTASTQGVSVDLEDGIVYNDGFGNQEALSGIEAVGGSIHIDVLAGDDNANRFYSFGGGDTLVGRGGDDEFFVEGANDIDGGDGIDTVSFNGVRTRADGSTETGTGVFVHLNLNRIGDGGFGDGGTITGVENVNGTEFRDFLYGDDNSNVLNGLGGDDVIRGLGGDDSLSGGDGDDYLNGGAGTDDYDGGDGFDRISFYDLSATQGVIADLAAGTITNDGFGNSETFTGIEALGGGTLHVDVLAGDDNDNFLLSVGIGDTLIGRGGDDRFQLQGATTVDGGDGHDVLTLASFLDTPSGREEGHGWTVDLVFGAIIDDGHYNYSSISSIEEIYGSGANDRLYGSDSSDIFHGGFGDDFLVGRGGNDSLNGGDGNDTIAGNTGDDEIRGDAGDDRLLGNVGADTIFGGDGNDTLLGGSQDDALWGDDGDDTLNGGTANDELNGGRGTDALDGGDGIDTAVFDQFGEATERVEIDLAAGTVGNDGFGTSDTVTNVENIRIATLAGLAGSVVFGDDNANHIEVQGANHVLDGRGGDDTFYIEAATDIDGGDGVDTVEMRGFLHAYIFGGGLTGTDASERVVVDLRAGFIFNDGFGNQSSIANVENITTSVERDTDDQVFGTETANIIQTNGGNDSVWGYGGDDTVSGGDGDDFLRGGEGNDTLFGGAGNDYLSGGAGVDSYEGGDGFDRVSFFDLTATQGVVADLSTGIVSNDGFGNFETMTGIENLGAGTLFADTFTGTDDSNFFIAVGGGDTLIGNGGDDLFQVQGANNIAGGDGTDTVYFYDNRFAGLDEFGDLIVEDSAGLIISLADEMIYSGGFGDSGSITGVENLTGTSFDDVLLGSSAANGIEGGAGNDVIRGYDGVDRLDGQDGDDILFGGSGEDELIGGAGNDYLNGGAGEDRFDGGDGIDRISFYDANATEGVYADLTDGVIQNDGFGNTEAFTSIESLGGGTVFNDFIAGDDNDNRLQGTGGLGDVILGRGGDDLIIIEAATSVDGGDGVDTLRMSSNKTFFIADTVDGYGVSVDLSSGMIVDDGFGDSIAIAGIENLEGSEFNDSLTGDAGDNVLSGWFGNDLLFGNDGNDTLNGEDGDDNLEGGNGDDIIDGGAGDDSIKGGNGSDTIIGGDGRDRLQVLITDGTTQGVVINLGTGVVDNDGWGNSETISGVENVTASTLNGDTIIGNDDNNQIVVLGTGNTVSGAGGDDVIVIDVGTVVDGGDGFDILALSGQLTSGIGVTAALEGVEINLATETIVNDGFGGISGFTGIELVVTSLLSSTDDLIRGSTGDDAVSTGAGADQFLGNDGDDRADMGSGDDRALGGNGNDLLIGQQGNDTLAGQRGNDFLFGGEGDDGLLGGVGDDWLDGGRGVDSLDGGDGFDIVSFASNADQGVEVNLQTGLVTNDGFGNAETMISIESVQGTSIFHDTVNGSGNNDIIIVSGADNTVFGRNGDDIITIDGGGGAIDGGSGTDTLQLSGVLFVDTGEDIVETVAAEPVVIDLAAEVITNDGFGGSGSLIRVENVNTSVGIDTADTITGSAFNNVINTHGGDDTVNAGGGNDTVGGGAGDDALSGGDGNDTLNGGDGNDTLNGDDGNDRLYGDDGNDTINGGSGRDILRGGAGDDVINGGVENDTIVGDDGNDTLNGDGGDDSIIGLDGNDTLNGGDGNDTLNGGRDDDRLDGGNGDDTLIGSVGDDLLVSSAGTDSYDGGGGTDTLSFIEETRAVGIMVNLAAGNAADIGGGNVESVSGVENVRGTGFADVLDGNGAANTLTGLAGNDELRGFGGNDVLDGGEGNDTLVGGDGDDTLMGGVGTNKLYGEGGADIFETSFGRNFVYDFVAGTDKIKVKSENVLDFDAFKDNAIETPAGNLTFTDPDSGGQMILIGLTKAALSATDFIFEALVELPESTAELVSLTVEAIPVVSELDGRMHTAEIADLVGMMDGFKMGDLSTLDLDGFAKPVLETLSEPVDPTQETTEEANQTLDIKGHPVSETIAANDSTLLPDLAINADGLGGWQAPSLNDFGIILSDQVDIW